MGFYVISASFFMFHYVSVASTPSVSMLCHSYVVYFLIIPLSYAPLRGHHNRSPVSSSVTPTLCMTSLTTSMNPFCGLPVLTLFIILPPLNLPSSSVPLSLANSSSLLLVVALKQIADNKLDGPCFPNMRRFDC